MTSELHKAPGTAQPERLADVRIFMGTHASFPRMHVSPRKSTATAASSGAFTLKRPLRQLFAPDGVSNAAAEALARTAALDRQPKARTALVAVDQLLLTERDGLAGRESYDAFGDTDRGERPAAAAGRASHVLVLNGAHNVLLPPVHMRWRHDVFIPVWSLLLLPRTAHTDQYLSSC